MTEKDAAKIIAIMLTTHGGCQWCAGDLVAQFVSEFPEMKEVADREWEICFPGTTWLDQDS